MKNNTWKIMSVILFLMFVISLSWNIIQSNSYDECVFAQTHNLCIFKCSEMTYQASGIRDGSCQCSDPTDETKPYWVEIEGNGDLKVLQQ